MDLAVRPAVAVGGVALMEGLLTLIIG
jgi:hypothetical protein